MRDTPPFWAAKCAMHRIFRTGDEIHHDHGLWCSVGHAMCDMNFKFRLWYWGARGRASRSLMHRILRADEEACHDNGLGLEYSYGIDARHCTAFLGLALQSARTRVFGARFPWRC